MPPTNAIIPDTYSITLIDENGVQRGIVSGVGADLSTTGGDNIAQFNGLIPASLYTATVVYNFNNAQNPRQYALSEPVNTAGSQAPTGLRQGRTAADYPWPCTDMLVAFEAPSDLPPLAGTTAIELQLHVSMDRGASFEFTGQATAMVQGTTTYSMTYPLPGRLSGQAFTFKVCLV